MKFYDLVCEVIKPTMQMDTTINGNIKKKSVQLSIHKMTLGQFLASIFLLMGVTMFFTVISVIATDRSFIEIIIASIILLLSTILLIGIKRYIYLKVNESKPYNINVYNRELPANLTPAHARFLVSDGLVDSLSLASTILDLINRGYLKINSKNNIDIFKKELYISKTNKNHDDLFEYEKYIINWFFDKDEISSKELKDKLRNEEENPCDKYAKFQGLVSLSFPITKYYKRIKNYKKKRSIQMNIAFYIIFIMVAISIIGNINYYLLFGGVLISALLYANIFFASPAYILNDEGTELVDKYKDLKKFLKDFSLIKENNSESIIIWDFYLPYSIALDMEGKAYDEINEFFGNNIYIQKDINNGEITDEDILKEINNEIIKAEEIYKKRS